MKTKGQVSELGKRRQQAANLQATVDDEHIKLTARKSIELRCGEAVIRLNADGNIEIEGVNISSVAKAMHRLRGGHIALN
jgi:uncharacterized protein (DUF2345 family)